MITITRNDSIDIDLNGEELEISKSSIEFDLDAAKHAHETLKSNPGFSSISIPVEFRMYDPEGNEVDCIDGTFEEYEIGSTEMIIDDCGTLTLVAEIQHVDHTFYAYFSTLKRIDEGDLSC